MNEVNKFMTVSAAETARIARLPARPLTPAVERWQQARPALHAIEQYEGCGEVIRQVRGPCSLFPGPDPRSWRAWVRPRRRASHPRVCRPCQAMSNSSNQEMQEKAFDAIQGNIATIKGFYTLAQALGKSDAARAPRSPVFGGVR